MHFLKFESPYSDMTEKQKTKKILVWVSWYQIGVVQNQTQHFQMKEDKR